MLRAILESKAGRVEMDNGITQSWRQVFKKREDLLTAVFFSRIRYLSATGEQDVLALLIGKDQASIVGEIEQIIFWRKYPCPLKNQNWVEPDVLVECKNVTILVEVKPPFGGDQYAGQWKKEIRSFIHDQPVVETNKPLIFLALGRIFDGWESVAKKLEKEFFDHRLSVKVREWQDISLGIAELCSNENGRDRAVYEDWGEAFGLFGMKKKLLSFKDMQNLQPLSKNFRSLFSGWGAL